MRSRVFRSNWFKLAIALVIPLICIATCGITVFTSISKLHYPNSKISEFPATEMGISNGVISIFGALRSNSPDPYDDVFNWYQSNHPDALLNEYSRSSFVNNSILDVRTISIIQVHQSNEYFPTEIYQSISIFIEFFP